MLTVSPIAAAFFLAASRIVSAPARFNCTRLRVTKGFFSWAVADGDDTTRPTSTSAIRDRNMTTSSVRIVERGRVTAVGELKRRPLRGASRTADHLQVTRR